MPKKTVVMITTPNGRKYARKVGHSLNAINHSYLLSSVSYFPKVFEKHPNLAPENCIIHSRAAHPNNSVRWMKELEKYVNKGFKVVNPVPTLQLTADKLKSMFYFDGIIDTPFTWGVKKHDVNRATYDELPRDTIIIKPYVSMSQGANVTKFQIEHTDQNFLDFKEVVNGMPTSSVVVQEFIKYEGIYRVVVLNEKALPFSFVDRPKGNKWKVSVCLNKGMKFVSNPNEDLLTLAEKVQKKVGGSVNFIDIFNTKAGFVLSEINTACNLTIHETLSKHSISADIAQTLVKHF